MTDKLLNAAILKLINIWINRRLKELTNTLNQGGKYNMKVTTSLGKFNLDVAVNEVSAIRDNDGHRTGQASSAEIGHFKMDIADTKTEVEMDGEELKTIHDTLLSDVKHLRETIVVPILNMIDKYAGKAVEAALIYAKIKGEEEAAATQSEDEATIERAKAAAAATEA